MKLEAWVGGRWFRDLGDNAGHLWGHVQVIKPPKLLEIVGPMMMSFPVASHVQYRLTEQPGGTLLKLTDSNHPAIARLAATQLLAYANLQPTTPLPPSTPTPDARRPQATWAPPPTTPTAPSPPPRMLRIEDWVWRRGHHDGMVLMDLEENERVDLQPDQEVAREAGWLHNPAKVEIVVRDRAGATHWQSSGCSRHCLGRRPMAPAL